MISDMSIQAYKSHVGSGSRKDSLAQLIAARDENGIPLSEEELTAAGMVFMIVGIFVWKTYLLTDQAVTRQQRHSLGCRTI
jgi:hypothetical protein